MIKFTADNYMVIDNPAYAAAFPLKKGDTLFMDSVAMKNFCPEPIHMLKRFTLGDSSFQGMVTKCVWSEKKWWQFWKKKKWLGCDVEIL